MKIPRFFVTRKRRDGVAHYWQVPARLRVQIHGELWPTQVIRLTGDVEQAIKQAKALNQQLDHLRKGELSVDRKGTMPWLMAEYQKSQYFTLLRDKTKRGYIQLGRHILRWSESKNHPQVSTLTTQKVLEFLHDYQSTPSLRDHLAGYLAVLCEYARRIGLITYNPARRLGLKRARRKKPIRIINVDQVIMLANKAIEMGYPHVAMGTLLHFDLGQRQGDILRLQKPRDYKNGVFYFKQSKTDQDVTIKPFLAETRLMLDALPAEQMMLVSKNFGAVQAQHYIKNFRSVANACGFLDLWEMELRHSCVIYCERAGLTPAEISTRTGHTLSSVIQILEKYRYRDSVVAHQGAVKLEDYRNISLSGSKQRQKAPHK
jgi:hypothetical protein